MFDHLLESVDLCFYQIWEVFSHLFIEYSLSLLSALLLGF